MNIRTALKDYGLEQFATGGLALIGLWGSILYFKGAVGLGSISSFVLYSRKFSGPINEIANIFNEIYSALAASERIFRLLDERFRLNIGNSEMERYAAKLGADCAFFISADPEDGDTACYAEGIGDVLMPSSVPNDNMKGYYIVVVKRDDIAVSTKDAYAAITPKQPAKCCRDIVRQPIETWKEELINDFEAPIFAMHPELAEIKESLYNLGAVYAAMSGSGSAIFGIFKHKPANIEEQFEGMFCKTMKL